MPPIVKDLFLSKKFVVALLATAAAVASYFGFNVNPTSIIIFITPLLVYVGAQGWADVGKEKAKVVGETSLRMHMMSLQHDTDMKKQSMAHEAAMQKNTPWTPKNPAGFAKLRVMVIAAVVGIGTGMVFYTPAATLGGCSHPAQSVLHFGQCVLDDGVLSDVLAALAQPNFLSQIASLALKDTGDLVSCALQAVAAQPAPVPSSGSGSAAQLVRGTPDVLATRAREALAMLRASSPKI